MLEITMTTFEKVFLFILGFVLCGGGILFIAGGVLMVYQAILGYFTY